MKLNTTNWEGFFIHKLFRLENGKANQGMLEEGNECFYVGAKKEDNGVMLHCKKDNALIQKGNCIIFICNGQGSVGYANYMDVDFIGTTDIVAGYNQNLNKYNGLFIATVLCQERPKYSFGRKWKTHLKETIINLPILHNEDGTPFIDNSKKYSEKGYVPDWIWMENYIKSLNHKNLTTINNKENTIKLNLDKWQSFEIHSILKVINGKGLTTEEIEENPGDIFCIQGGESKNGSIGSINRSYCEKQGYVIIDEMCLTVARVGTAGCVNFWEDPCAIGDKCKGLILKEHPTKATYLFIQTILNQLQYKYSYGRGLVTDKYMSDIIKLPILYNIDGSPFIDDTRKYSKRGYVPDWNFMENYIKSLPYGDRI